MSLRLPEKEYKVLCKVILQRDAWKCRCCGSRNALHVHHIIFRSQQGPDTTWNLITLCSSCHDGVHVDVKLVLQSDGVVVNADLPVRFMRLDGWRPK